MQVSRFFSVKPNTYDNQSKSFNLVCDNDLLPITKNHNAHEIYRDDDKVILSVLLTKADLEDFADIVEVEDPLSIEAVVLLGIQASYCGEEYSSVPIKGLFYYFPELEGEKEVGTDEDGSIIKQLIVRRPKWLGV